MSDTGMERLMLLPTRLRGLFGDVCPRRSWVRDVRLWDEAVDLAQPAEDFTDKDDLVPLACRKPARIDVAETDVLLQHVALEHTEEYLHRLYLVGEVA